MMFNFVELFWTYLIPFAIAIPIGLLLIYFGTRRSGDAPVEDHADQPPEVDDSLADSNRIGDGTGHSTMPAEPRAKS
jgi:hypothetical protein